MRRALGRSMRLPLVRSAGLRWSAAWGYARPQRAVASGHSEGLR